MKTFIEQKAELRQEIIELENENRRLQRQADDAEEAIIKNQSRVIEIYQILEGIGKPIEL